MIPLPYLMILTIHSMCNQKKTHEYILHTKNITNFAYLNQTIRNKTYKTKTRKRTDDRTNIYS